MSETTMFKMRMRKAAREWIDKEKKRTGDNATSIIHILIQEQIDKDKK